MAKFLIAGAKGQVGYCLTQQLQSKHEILAVDRDELDITDQSAVTNAVENFRPDVIINAAAHTAVDRAETEVELSDAINVKGPQYLAEAAKDVGAAILHISTDYVFDGQREGKYKETDATEPQGVYGKTKLAGEQAVALFKSNHRGDNLLYSLSVNGKEVIRFADSRAYYFALREKAAR